MTAPSTSEGLAFLTGCVGKENEEKEAEGQGG